MDRRRLGTIVSVLAGTIVFAAAGYVITKSDPVPEAGTIPTSSAGPSSFVPSPAFRPGIAFLGDDYTAGVGASGSGKRFATRLATALNATEKNFGVAGAGYAKAGTGGKRYADRVDAIAAAKPNMVVVSGGRNDLGDDPATLATAAERLFAALRAKLPTAELVAVAPFWGDSDQPRKLTTIGSAVKTAVQKVGGAYLALSDPLYHHPGYMSDGADPNDAGYAAIAGALRPLLASLLRGG